MTTFVCTSDERHCCHRKQAEETALPPVRSEPMLADDLDVADCAVTLEEARGVIRRLTRRVREQQDRLNNQAAWIAELKANEQVRRDSAAPERTHESENCHDRRG